MPRARWATISLLLLFLPLSCGDDDSGNHQDGGQPGVHALVILTPPGPSIGLAPGESVVLRVSYLDPQDRPVPNVQVGFAIQGSAQGATLGGFHGYTDASGTAEMLLTAASVPARFTVNVTAPQALPVFFEVAVSTAGFTSLEVQPSYRGSHSLSDFGSLMAEVRFDLSCTDVHPLGDFPADRERVIDGFNGLALFQNLPVDLSYAVAVRALGVDGRTLAWSCSDLISGQLLREATMRLHLLLEDLETSASGRYSLLTRLELPAGSQSELRAYFSAFLPAADCSHALEQLLLDCILDAAFPDGAADCSINSTDPSVVDIEALRGVKDAQGCRGTDTVGGQPSLELELRESMDATGAERVAALLTFLSTPSADISGLQIRSELSIAENPATKDIYSWHALKSVCLPGINPDLWFPLADLGAVPLSVASLPSSRSEGTPTFVTIPPHGLSLQPGWAALHAAWLEHLRPLGLPRDPRLALPLLVQSYQGPASAPLAIGCPAVASWICEALGQITSCLDDACEDAIGSLAAQLAVNWSARPSPVGPDAMFATSALLVDEDGDCRAERLCEASTPCNWLLTLRFGEHWLTPVSATFDATRMDGQ